MNKAGRTRDEVIQDFRQGPAPVDTYASATEPNFSTYPAKQPTGEFSWPNIPPRTPVAAPTGTRLPASVSASQIARASERRMYNMGPAESPESAPLLAGTRVVASQDGGKEIGESIAEGHGGEALSGALEVVGNVASSIGGLALMADGYARLRRSGGGR